MKKGRKMKKKEIKNMEIIADMLGVHIGERFHIRNRADGKLIKSIYHFENNGLLHDDNTPADVALRLLITGANIIVKINKSKFRPRMRDDYLYIDAKGKVQKGWWLGSPADYYQYNAGNCFETGTEITGSDIDRIVSQMTKEWESGH